MAILRCQGCGKEFDDDEPLPAGACEIEEGTGFACSVTCADLCEGADSESLGCEDDD
jgi:hypothetical protein